MSAAGTSVRCCADVNTGIDEDDGGCAAGGETRPMIRDDIVGVDEVDMARSREYAVLSTLLSGAPGSDLLARLAALLGDDSPLGLAHAAIAAAAARATAAQVEREYFDLFIGLGRGELLPYGSYYLTGFLQGRPLARLRADLAVLGIERAVDRSEPEDHAAVLCEVMAGLISGCFPAAPAAERAMFEEHLKPWIGRFFADLERAAAAEFYRPVGTLGRTFMEIESQAFAVRGGRASSRGPIP